MFLLPAPVVAPVCKLLHDCFVQMLSQQLVLNFPLTLPPGTRLPSEDATKNTTVQACMLLCATCCWCYRFVQVLLQGARGEGDFCRL
jgi:hypothetical protein